MATRTDTSREQQEFTQLIADNQGIIHKICHSYCTDKNDRDDLAQEIVLTLWKGFRRYDPAYKFSTWMYKVALNVAITWYRNAAKRKGTISFGDLHLEIEDPPPGSAAVEAGINQLQRHISRLKDLERALIILYFEQRSYREIAEIMGITETNVATKVSRIKEKLRQSMLQDEQG